MICVNIKVNHYLKKRIHKADTETFRVRTESWIHEKVSKIQLLGRKSGKILKGLDFFKATFTKCA